MKRIEPPPGQRYSKARTSRAARKVWQNEDSEEDWTTVLPGRLRYRLSSVFERATGQPGPHLLSWRHSALRATAGSTAAARRPGNQLASAASASTSAADSVSTSPSDGATSNSSGPRAPAMP